MNYEDKMSYEGYNQCLCQKGHYFISPTSTTKPCPDCAGPAVWTNPVDDTNCDDVGIIPRPVLKEHFLLTAEPEETFRIPTEEETAKLQHYWRGREYIPLGRPK